VINFPLVIIYWRIVFSFINSTSLQWLVLGVINTGMLIGCSILPPHSEGSKRKLLNVPNSIYNVPNSIYQIHTPISTDPSSQTCYQVKSGDNLYRIGKAYGIEYQQLAKWNGLTVSRWDGNKPVYDLVPGQRLKVSSYAVCY